MNSPRAVAFAAALFGLVVGCGSPIAPRSATPSPIDLHLDAACDLAPSAAVEWVLDAKPRAIAEMPDLIPAIARVVSEARFASFAAAHGGIDVRQLTALCIAKYPTSTLAVARTLFDPLRVERAFTERVTNPSTLGRAVDLPNPLVVRTWGDVNGEAQEIVLFGREALVFEQGHIGRARVAEAFALRKLRRAAPALRGPGLTQAVALAGEAPVRFFIPGPFEGEAAAALGGLLRASTAVAITARFNERLTLSLILTGAWGKDASAAAERLSAAVNVVCESPLGHLLGFHRPLAPPHVRATEDALVLDITVDAETLARGLHDALDAPLEDMMSAVKPLPGKSLPRAAE